MNAHDLLADFALPLLTGGAARMALPFTDDLFAALEAEPPPDLPALADAITFETRLIWATAPAARTDADIVYTVAMLHDLLGAMHPVFTRSGMARLIGGRIDARVAERRRDLTTPDAAVRRHVLATAALRLVRTDEHIDLRGLGRISGYGEAATYQPLPWRVEEARYTSELSALDVLTPTRQAILARLSPLTAFMIAAQNGRPLPWIRWLTGVPALLRLVVHTLAHTPNGPTALVQTVPSLVGRRALDIRWWLGLMLVVQHQTRYGDDAFRAVIDALRPHAPALGAPPMRIRRDAEPPESLFIALQHAGLES